MRWTTRQQEALDSLTEFWLENCRAPTLRELLPKTSYASTSGLAAAWRALEEKGEIEISSSRPIPMWVVRVIGNCQ